MSGALVYAGIGGFLSGVVWGSLFSSSLTISLLFGLLGCGVIVVSVYEKRKDMYIILSLFLICVSFGIARVYMSDARFNASEEKQLIEGVVIREPDVRDNMQWIVVEREVRTRIAVDHFPQIRYGDKIRVEGDTMLPENFETDTGRIFDYMGYLKRDNIKYVMWYPEITIIERGGGNIVVTNLLTLKHIFKSHIDSVIPEPHASLANGILLGSKQGLGEKLERAFRDTGIVHIVVLSGYNVTIVALFVLWVFSFLPFRIARMLALGSIIIFAIIVGGGATVIRASLMASLAIFAPVIHRTYNIHRSLAFAAFAMVLLNPYVLVFDPSFQLSFLATIGLVYLSPVIARPLSFIPSRFEVQDIVVATISTQIFVLPFLLYMTGQISIVSLPVNLLVLPVIPIAMLAAFLTGISGFFWSVCAHIFAYPTYVLLEYVFVVVQTLAAVPYATVSTPPFPFWVVLIFYIPLTPFLIWYWRKYEIEPTIFESLTVRN